MRIAAAKENAAKGQKSGHSPFEVRVYYVEYIYRCLIKRTIAAMVQVVDVFRPSLRR